MDRSHQLTLITQHRRDSELSTRDAAIALGQNERTIRRAIARGDLVASKRGSTYGITPDALMRYAALGGSRANSGSPTRLLRFPPPLTVSSHLPQPLSSFVGRVADVVAVSALLQSPAVRLLTLTGPGGIGKTRLALAVAEAMRHSFRDGALFVPLAGVARPEQVLPTICQALGLREVTGRNRRELLRASLQDTQRLLVIDNVEHVLGAAPEIAELAVMGSGVTVLVTSRAPLRVRGEREYPVDPLPLPPTGRPITAAKLLASDAARLFIERAQAHDPSFQVTNESAPLVAEICALLDGLPLAIELAAARTKVLPVPSLRARLERRLPLLTGGVRDGPHRHRTMRDAIAWSYDLLAPDEQRLLRRLAVFRGGFTLEAAESVGGDEGGKGGRFAPGGRGEDETSPLSPSGPQAAPRERSDPPAALSVIDLIAALVDQSLLLRETAPHAEPRFRMLETVREFGEEHLQDDEATTARAAHASAFLALAQALRPMTTSNATRAPIDRLAADEANLHHALTWLDEHGPAGDFVALVVASWSYWYTVGRLREGERWLERALAKGDTASLPDRARLAIDDGERLMLQGASARAQVAFAAGVTLLRDVGDPFDLAMGLIASGASLTYAGHHVQAEAHFTEALALAEAIDDLTLRAAVAGDALANLSVSARSQGAFARAAARSEEAWHRYQGHGLDLAETRTLMDMAGIARDLGDHRLVVARYQVCLERLGERGDMRLIADALTGIAGAASAGGQHHTAVLLFAAAAGVRQRDGISMVLPRDLAANERQLRVLREALGDAAFATAWSDGEAMTVAEASAMARTVSLLPGVPAAASPQDRIVLTTREREVLRLLAAGQSNREIAAALFVAPRTVSWHVSAVLRKLHVATRRDAVERALAVGLL